MCISTYVPSIPSAEAYGEQVVRDVVVRLHTIATTAYIRIPHCIDVCSGRGDAHEVRVLGKSQRYSPLNLVGGLSRYQDH